MTSALYVGSLITKGLSDNKVTVESHGLSAAAVAVALHQLTRREAMGPMTHSFPLTMQCFLWIISVSFLDNP